MKEQPENEVEVRVKRRVFSDDYKRRIVAEVDKARREGMTIGNILRREGLHYKAVRIWSEQLHDTPKKRGRKAKSEQEKRIDELQVENTKLQERIADYEALTEAQGKVSALLQNALRKSATSQPSPQ